MSEINCAFCEEWSEVVSLFVSFLGDQMECYLVAGALLHARERDVVKPAQANNIRWSNKDEDGREIYDSQPKLARAGCERKA